MTATANEIPVMVSWEHAVMMASSHHVMVSWCHGVIDSDVNSIERLVRRYDLVVEMVILWKPSCATTWKKDAAKMISFATMVVGYAFLESLSL